MSAKSRKINTTQVAASINIVGTTNAPVISLTPTLKTSDTGSERQK